jgi:hypothetical protein
MPITFYQVAYGRTFNNHSDKMVQNGQQWKPGPQGPATDIVSIIQSPDQQE